MPFMNHDEVLQLEELIRSAIAAPSGLSPLRRRVLRSARDAVQRRTVVRRVCRVFVGCAVAVLLALITNQMLAPGSRDNGRVIPVQGGMNSFSTGSGAAEWNTVEDFRRERERHAEILRGPL